MPLVDTMTEAERLEFTWNLTAATANMLTFELNFTYPELISADAKYSDYVEVYTDFGDFEPGWDASTPVFSARLAV